MPCLAKVTHKLVKSTASNDSSLFLYTLFVRLIWHRLGRKYQHLLWKVPLAKLQEYEMKIILLGYQRPTLYGDRWMNIVWYKTIIESNGGFLTEALNCTFMHTCLIGLVPYTWKNRYASLYGIFFKEAVHFFKWGNPPPMAVLFWYLSASVPSSSQFPLFVIFFQETLLSFF